MLRLLQGSAYSDLSVDDAVLIRKDTVISTSLKVMSKSGNIDEIKRGKKETKSIITDLKRIYQEAIPKENLENHENENIKFLSYHKKNSTKIRKFLLCYDTITVTKIEWAWDLYGFNKVWTFSVRIYYLQKSQKLC